MKILHTSDWHLGQHFKGRSREEEHKAFLLWLEESINELNIDTLIVAGDIFDVQNPPKYALSMYHDFLVAMTKSCCKDVIIVAGNHDSIATIEMTKNFAKLLNIHIVATGEDENEVLVKIEKDKKLQAIVCAVPYLRDKIIRDASKLKDNKELESEYKDGIKRYYNSVYEKAKSISKDVPIIATGHFTTTGSSINPDSERELYIGKLADIDSSVLSGFDYVAMGHLHSSQMIDKQNHMRYSGSPIPLSFSESSSQKSVVIVEFEKKEIKNIELLNIPSFKKLYRLKGSLDEVKKRIDRIKDIQNRPFLDIVLSGDAISSDIKEFQQLSFKNGVDIVSIKKEINIEDKVYIDADEDMMVNDLDEVSVFEKRLELEESLRDDESLKQKLMQEYKKVLEELKNED